MYGGGAGLKTITHALNAEHAPCPRPILDRVAGWCPSSVRMVLKQPLYRGEFIYGRVKKRDPAGHVPRHAQPRSNWLAVPVPELRIISPELAAEVDARFEGTRRRL